MLNKAKGRLVAASVVAMICLGAAPAGVSAAEKFWCEDENAATISTPDMPYCGPCVDLCDENCICGIYLC